MDIFGILNLLGGLALFLYGMSAMGDGLVQLSGGRLEKILEKLTQKKIMAVLLGLLVTAVIQSSSATTVMVVGFVNSGIMNLSQAVGIIMGANIGTTVTSWLLSLTGIQGSNLFLKLLKPSSFSPILAAIGVILTMTAKEDDRKKNIGTIFVGFAILMFGMEAMSSSVSPLAQNEKFTGILTAFSNPILGLLAGAALTAIIQSSSASVGILQALCMTGAVSFGMMYFIIYVGKHPGCTPSELTQRLHLDWGHSQRSLTKLAEDGFLTKEKSGRSYHLELTEKGRTAFAVCHRVFYGWDARNLTGLTADEQRQLLELLQKAAQKGSM